MRCVILRDDDTNALTPPAHLDLLYRPFLERELPVNLAVIPKVRPDVTLPDGRPEGFLVARESVRIKPQTIYPSADSPSLNLGRSGTNMGREQGRGAASASGVHRPLPLGEGRGEGLDSVDNCIPISHNPELVEYLNGNPGYRMAQHGYCHDPAEFDRNDRKEIIRRLENGADYLERAGFRKPVAFVAPHDKFSRTSLREVASRFTVVSAGWFERKRLPRTWWPRYLLKKIRHASHWRIGSTLLLSHPGCLLSRYRPYEGMMDAVRRAVEGQPLTVLVTHWWEYFPENRPDTGFINILHQLADYLADKSKFRVLGFDELATENGTRAGR